MRIIVGLGNPGKLYRNNRHNVGHMVIDKFKSQKSKLKKIVVSKTDCFMNESGKFVKKLVEQYKINVSDLWIIHDDLDIPLGSYKIQKGKGPRRHKGVLSICQQLGSQAFWRVRIGIDNRCLQDRVSGEKYVLEDFTGKERKVLDGVIEEVCKKLATY